MKLKLLLLFLVVLGLSKLGNSQTTKPYTQLLITEALQSTTEHNYFEITNMGNETVDLANFEFAHLGGWDGGTANPWPQVGFGTTSPKFFKFPSKLLAPGESFVMATAADYNPEVWKKDPANFRERVTVKDFYDVQPNGTVKTIADLLVHYPERSIPASTDEITPYWNALEGWGGREAYFLRHHWVLEDGITKDSAVVDQVGGTFDDTDGKNTKVAHAVAGVQDATWSCVLIRRNAVKTGNLDFNAGRGTDYDDSEWIPVPVLGGYDHWGTAGWRRAFWTVGNQVNAVLDANTLTPKSNKVTVDLNASTITVPWGVRKNDSLMYQFNKKPGLAWGYEYSTNSADSMYISARTGDVLKLYVCGDVVTQRDFSIIVTPPTASDNKVIPKTSYNFRTGYAYAHPQAFGGMRITDGVSPIDSITNLAYATRVDSLLKYLEKPEKASWRIVFKSGVAQPDLKTGDILRVTAENGTSVKDYFIKLEKFVPASNALLASITWPDIPESFKGAVASTYGWKGDTIPGFTPSNKNYIVQVPLEYNGVPALAYTKQQLDSKVEVTRAKNLTGSVEDRTVTIKVTAENDTVISNYTIRFDKEKDPSNVQPYVAEPFISQIVFRSEWATSFVEIANPGTEIMDLSNYMITTNWGPENPGFGWNNATTEWALRYLKYIPGKKWQDEANWLIQPRIAIPDNAVNAMVYPGEVFVMAHMTNCNGFTTADKHPYSKYMDINFGTVPTTVPGYEQLSNPWGENIGGNSIPNVWCNNSIYLYKILNDTVKNGLKPATDRNDFELIESWGGLDGNNWKPDGFDAGSQLVGYTRKPNIYKGNPEPNGSWNNDPALSEWTHQRPADYASYNLGWPWTDIAINTGIGSLTIDEITIYRSTVKSNMYKVSEGFSMEETIKGVKTPTTVTDFLANIIKANEGQTLTVTAVAGGELTGDALLSNGDMLTVLSADGTNTSMYTLSVTVDGLSPNTLLTSATLTITQDGETGTIEGFGKNTTLKSVFDAVTPPADATITIVDANDAYMSFVKLNYDTAYVNTLATDAIYFEVVAENGINKTVYQLKPTVDPSEAYVTSDVYSVDQLAYVVQFIPGGTSVHSLLSNLTPATGATMKVYDKQGFERIDGDIYQDDKLEVKSSDGSKTQIYHFSMLVFNGTPYLAFVLSDSYIVDQLLYKIQNIPVGTTVSEFKNNLYPSFGATIKVVGSNGNENTGTLAEDDVLVVTAANGINTASYAVELGTGAPDKISSAIKMYPNPTTGRVIVQGLAKGNRVQVFNASGVALRDVVANSATDYVSLEAQPAGIYIFVVSSGAQHINIQKIVKK